MDCMNKSNFCSFIFDPLVVFVNKNLTNVVSYEYYKHKLNGENFYMHPTEYCVSYLEQIFFSMISNKRQKKNRKACECIYVFLRTTLKTNRNKDFYQLIGK